MKSWYQIANSIVKIYINHFINNIQIFGKENIPVGPKIIVANHPNATDGLMLPSVFPEKLHFMIQASVFETPFIGRILAYAEQIPVVSGKGRQALSLAREKLAKGGSVVIFPEGRLNNDEMLHRGQIGAAMLAVQTGLPLLLLGFYVPPDALQVINGYIENRATSAHWQIGGNCFIRVGNSMQLKGDMQSGKRSGNLREYTQQIMANIGELVNQAKHDAGE